MICRVFSSKATKMAGSRSNLAPFTRHSRANTVLPAPVRRALLHALWLRSYRDEMPTGVHQTWHLADRDLQLLKRVPRRLARGHAVNAHVLRQNGIRAGYRFDVQPCRSKGGPQAGG